MGWTLAETGDQKGRLAIITGANIGLGLQTAHALAEKGCTLVLACRNPQKAEAAKEKILREHPKAKITCMTLDVSSLQSVQSFVSTFRKKHKRLDLLINNAGIMMPPFALSADGFESQLATNYLGHFALTGLLLGLLDKTPDARVVSLSSVAHNFSSMRFNDLHFSQGYDKRLAYGQSKFACLMFAYELNRRLVKAGSHVLSVAAHPGISATNLGQHIPFFLSALMPIFGQSAEKGALPTLYAALGEDIEGGDFCGPSGLYQVRGEPVKVRSNRSSHHEENAKKLWAVSEEMTGVRYLSESV